LKIAGNIDSLNTGIQNQSCRKENTLFVTSIYYLSIPVLIFSLGWLKSPYSIISAVILSAAIVLLVNSLKKIIINKSDLLQSDYFYKKQLIIAFVAVLITLISGAGGYGYQDTDWQKHNSILKSLIENEWCVTYNLEGNSLLLVYYIGYYLPAALIGKLLGWTSANHFLFVWTSIGIYLSISWLIQLTKAKTHLCIMVFIFFSGMDIAGSFFTGSFNRWHIEWWAKYFEYSSNMTLFFWVPQQAIPGWILSGVIFFLLDQKKLMKSVLLLLAIGSIWSPFIVIGIIPFVIMEFYRKIRHWKNLLEVFSLINLAGLVIGFVCFLYYLSRFQEYVLPEHLTCLEKKSLHTFQFTGSFTVVFLLFILLEFGIMHILIYLGGIVKNRVWLIISSLVLVVLPFFSYGHWNDLAMRSSIPALFITQVFAIAMIEKSSSDFQRKLTKILLVLILTVGSTTAIIEMKRHLSGINYTLVKIPKKDEILSLPDLQKTNRYKEIALLEQYVGSADSYFMKYIGKK